MMGSGIRVIQGCTPPEDAARRRDDATHGVRPDGARDSDVRASRLDQARELGQGLDACPVCSEPGGRAMRRISRDHGASASHDRSEVRK